MDRIRRLCRSLHRGYLAWAGETGPYGAAPYPLLQGEWEAMCREDERPHLTLWVREEPLAEIARAA